MADKIVLRVNTFEDQNDGSSYRGLSLRDAILMANANPSKEYEILLPAGTYPLTIKNVLLPPRDRSADGDTLFESRLATGDLDIIGKVTIIGLGTDPTQTIIDAEPLLTTLPREGDPFSDNSSSQIGDRVFDVLSGEKSRRKLPNGQPANGKLTLKNVTVQGGRIVEENIDANPKDGGAINIDEGATATIIDSIIRNNSTIGAGGAINNSGRLTIINSTVADSQSDSFGGGDQ